MVEPICLEVYAELRTGTKDVSSSLRPRVLWEAEYKLSKLKKLVAIYSMKKEQCFLSCRKLIC